MATRSNRPAVLTAAMRGMVFALALGAPAVQAVGAADAPVKPAPTIPVVTTSGDKPATPGDTSITPSTSTDNSAASGSTHVPPLTHNFTTRADVWTYSPDINAREPYSYSRKIKTLVVDHGPNPGPTQPTTQPGKVFVDGMSGDYANTLDQFNGAMDALSKSNPKTRDANLDLAKSQLNGCLANLDSLRSQAAKYEKATMEPADRKKFDYYYAASNRLMRAARQQFEWVNLQIRFSSEVLHKETYNVTAIVAHREDPQWPYSAVLFHGITDPVRVGEPFPRAVNGKTPDIEMKIVSLTPTTVTVLFQHQATFEIPVIRDEAADGGRGKGK